MVETKHCIPGEYTTDCREPHYLFSIVPEFSTPSVLLCCVLLAQGLCICQHYSKFRTMPIFVPYSGGPVHMGGLQCGRCGCFPRDMYNVNYIIYMRRCGKGVWFYLIDAVCISRLRVKM